jgi:hypothetical protein
MANLDKFGDERLKKDSGAAMRGSRDSADVDRVHQDGTALSAEERRRLLRQEHVQEVLPTPPAIPGYHMCWVSTTNSTDPVYKRIQRGYVPVKASEVPGFGTQFAMQGGEFDGCIACNEMLLFKIPAETFNDLMTIYHHDMPAEQEQAIKERINQQQSFDSDGRPLTQADGDFNRLGQTSRAPTFV